jgi:hypothetical protein
MGFGVGLMQGRLLRDRLGAPRRWAGWTTLGLAAPFLVRDASLLVTAIPYSLAGYVAAGGLCAALLQWRLLRPEVRGAVWWLVITPAGWLLAGSTVWLNELLPKTRGLVGALQYLAVVFSGGLVLGAACAAAWRLTRK